MRCALSVVFAAIFFCSNAALEETVDFSGIADIEVGDERSTMRHAACASGFFLTEDGYFVTDKYLTAGAKRLIVVCENKAYEAEPVELPATNRCALLKVKGGPFTPVVFAQDDGGKAGERLLVAGFAASDENGIIPQLSWGVLSGKKIKDEMELFVGVVPEQVGALVTNGKGQFEGMVLGTGRKSQSVCRILKRREIDRSLPIDVRRRFTYVAKYPTPSFDGLGTMMAKCTGLVLVYDEARRKRNMRERGMEGKSFEDDKGLTFEKLETLTEKAKEKKTHLARTGSGFFITADGYFITNQHVVDGAEEVVVLHGGKSYAARVVATSRDKDLALVKMDGGGRPVCAGGTN